MTGHLTPSHRHTAAYTTGAPVDLERADAAAIPVEPILGDVILIAGGNDRVWDSVRAAEEIDERRQPTDYSLPSSPTERPATGRSCGARPSRQPAATSPTVVTRVGCRPWGARVARDSERPGASAMTTDARRQAMRPRPTASLPSDQHPPSTTRIVRTWPSRSSPCDW